MVYLAKCSMDIIHRLMTGFKEIQISSLAKTRQNIQLSR